jgi:hypothetical protein
MVYVQMERLVISFLSAQTYYPSPQKSPNNPGRIIRGKSPPSLHSLTAIPLSPSPRGLRPLKPPSRKKIATAIFKNIYLRQPPHLSAYRRIYSVYPLSCPLLMRPVSGRARGTPTLRIAPGTGPGSFAIWGIYRLYPPQRAQLFPRVAWPVAGCFFPGGGWAGGSGGGPRRPSPLNRGKTKGRAWGHG